ncbi:hypothetical protein JW933_05970, partial [candidate division FCPU426 bacterium]|nr:hypothetical protein [candidate division FCPU426 bacterium]
MDPSAQKTLLRRKLLAARRALSPEARAEASRNIWRRVCSLPQWVAATNIGCYVSLPDEVSTHELLIRALAPGKNLSVPGMVAHDSVLCFSRVRELGGL